MTKFVMYLNDAKVARRFGAHPERGCIVPGRHLKVTVGVRFSLSKLDFEPDDDVTVQPRFALRCLKRGKWEVNCDPRFHKIVSNYLMDFM